MSESKTVYVDTPAGSYVFREGDVGSDMYIIESGSVEVLRSARGSVPMATLGPGDFFGEMAILEDQRRFASVRAVVPSRLLRIDRAAFADMLRENFEIAVRIMRKLVARLRRTEEQLQATQSELDLVRRGGPGATPALPHLARPVGQTLQAEVGKSKAPAPTRRVVAVDPAQVRKPVKLVHGDSGAEFALDIGKAELLIGRPDPVTGLLPEINLGPLDTQRSLSRRHAKVVMESGIPFLREEVGTTNGTFVNGDRLPTGQARPLAAGDTLRFGSVELRVESL
jgi:CRP-like cAMP-binding protein